jgi:hypothetical protein
MSNSTFMSLYYNSLKIKEAQDTNVDVDNNSTQMFGDGDIVAIAQGITTVQAQATLVFTNDGTNGPGVVSDVLNNKTGTISFLFATKLFSCPVQATKVSIKSSSKSGETTASCTWINTAKPQLVG